MSASKFGNQIGISTPAMRKWRLGTSKPTLETRKLIAGVLGVPLDVLLRIDADEHELDAKVAEMLAIDAAEAEHISHYVESVVEYDGMYPNRSEFFERFGEAYDLDILEGLKAMAYSVGDLSVEGWMRLATTIQADRRGKAVPAGTPAPKPEVADDAPLVLRPGTTNHERAVELLQEWGHGALLKKGVEIRWGAEGYNVGTKLVRWPAGFKAGKRGAAPVRTK